MKGDIAACVWITHKLVKERIIGTLKLFFIVWNVLHLATRPEISENLYRMENKQMITCIHRQAKTYPIDGTIILQ